METKESVTYIKRSKTVPTEDVFTSLAHHLCTTIVPFYGDMADRTPLDVRLLKTSEWNPG